MMGNMNNSMNGSMNRMGGTSKDALLMAVNQAGFAVTEANLYLDTHPSDPAALQYFQEYTQLRKQALQDYAAMYGPLTVDLAIGSRGKWDWIQQPWPWEGGTC